MAKATNGRFPKVLFFISDFKPTDEEMAAAGEIGPGVVFRNAQYIPENPSPGSIEDADFVAGNVPKPYADRYPAWGASEGANAAVLFDHDDFGNRGPEVNIDPPRPVPTSETGSPVDPETNLSLDPTTGEPLVRAKTATNEGDSDVIDPATGKPFVDPSTPRPLPNANNGTDATNAGAEAGAAAATTIPATPASAAAADAPASQGGTAWKPSGGNPAPTPTPAPAAAPKATGKTK